ncbi:hypothetical protein, partial [Staphylococcus hominis]|uniref:hypothetical protein n=1 Tax=Staphylococcus hominis TaxID=1290 RepID=UPI001C92F6DD
PPYPLIHLKPKLFHPSYHHLHSSQIPFKIAPSLPLKQPPKKSHPLILQPIMKLTIQIPQQYIAHIIGHLTPPPPPLHPIQPP